MPRPSFHLDKWYLDCTAPDGRVFIGYWAALRWGWLRLRYAAAIEITPAGVAQRTSLRRAAPPRVESRAIRWDHAPLGVSFRAAPLHESAARCLIEGPNQGSVVWHPVAPLADVRVQSGSRAFEGHGYIERLTLTTRPWRLPIDELLWGRFTGEGTSLVWIEWRGPRPLRLLLCNTQERPLDSVSKESIVWHNGRLSMTEQRTIRDGPLGGSVLSRPPLRWLAPRSMRDAHETKWLSRAALTDSAGRATDGWAIHESVRFRSTP